ncbi:hypothetical protein ES707_20209 [subsurface metagenome]
MLGLLRQCLYIEYSFIKGLLGNSFCAIRGMYHKRPFKLALGAVLFLTLFLIFTLLIHLHSLEIWKGYLNLYYHLHSDLHKSGTPDLLYFDEILLLHFFIFPILVSIASVILNQQNVSEFVRAIDKGYNSYSAVGAIISFCIFPYLLYLVVIVLVGAIKGLITFLFPLLISQFIIAWFCFVPPVLILTVHGNKDFLKIKILAAMHIILASFLCLYWVSVSTGGYGLVAISFLQSFFDTARPNGIQGLWGLYFLCLLNPVYVNSYSKIIGSSKPSPVCLENSSGRIRGQVK